MPLQELDIPPGFLPLSKTLPYWPSDIFGQKPDFLSEIGVTRFKVEAGPDKFLLSGELVWSQELEFDLPAVKALSLVLLNKDGLTKVAFSGGVVFEEGELTDFYFQLEGVSFAIRISNDVLYPVKKEREKWVPEMVGGVHKPLDIQFDEVTLRFDMEGNFELVSTPTVSFPLFGIGKTGFVIQADDIALYLSKKQDPPQGAVNGFKGIAFKKFSLFFPSELELGIDIDSLNIENGWIGTGGFSGKVSLKGEKAGLVSGKVLGMDFNIQALTVTFAQNIPTEVAIGGALTIPSFDQPVQIMLSLDSDGNLRASLAGLAADKPFYTVTKAGLAELSLAALSLDTAKKSLQVSGKLTPQYAGVEWPAFELQNLLIDAEGHLKLGGGWLELPKGKSFDFEGFKLEITKIGFGKDGSSPWIGFSGGIQIAAGLPLKGAVEGLRIILKDGHPEVQLEGISVAFLIQDVLYFDGNVARIKKGDVSGIQGGVKAVFYPLDGLGLNVQFMAGKQFNDNPTTFFFLALDVNLPVGIPLGSTGLSLYGMKGLVSYNVGPNKESNETWLEWSKKGNTDITDVKTKWRPANDQLGFGAGVLLGTGFDNGFTFSANVLLVIMLPGPIVLLEGKANFLKKRADSIKDEPPLRVLAVFDGQAKTVLMNVMASYELPKDPASPEKDGLIINADAEAEAYFSFNRPNSWHFYLGQESPESKQTRIEVFRLLKALSYFMIDSKGFRMGLWVGYKNSWKKGPLSITLEAWMAGSAVLNWNPVQVLGEIKMSGEVSLKAFGHGLGISLYSSLSAKTPTPKFIRGEFKVKINLPWPLPDPKATVTLEWKKEAEPPFIQPLSSVGIEHAKTTDKWTLVENSLEKLPTVPLDAMIALIFARPVDDFTGMAAKNAYMPEKIGGEYEFHYRLVSVTLEKKLKSGPIASGPWQPLSRTTPHPLQGEWQAIASETGKVENLKLLLGAKTPLDFTRELEHNESLIFSIQHHSPHYPCDPIDKLKYLCMKFEAVALSSTPILILEKCLLYSFIPVEIVSYPHPLAGTQKAFALKRNVSSTNSYSSYAQQADIPPFLKFMAKIKGPAVAIVFPEEMAEIQLYLSKDSAGEALFFDANGEMSKRIEINPSDEREEQPITLSAEFGYRSMLIQGELLISKICLLTVEEQRKAQRQLNNLRVLEETLSEEWENRETLLLDPNHYYKLTVSTKATRKPGGEEIKTHEFFFQTGNPPGVLPLAEGEIFKSLSPYIEATIPPTGAINEPRRPAYRSYDIGVVFNETRGHVEEMYLRSDLTLSIELFDSEGKRVGNFENQWGVNPKLNLTREMQQWRQILDHSTCHISSEHDSYQHNAELHRRNNGAPLESNKVFRAQVLASNTRQSDVLYEFNFLTSRYCSFAHHLHSFQDKVWDYLALRENAFPITLSAVQQALRDNLEDKKFQALVTLFQLDKRPPPQQLELLLLSAQLQRGPAHSPPIWKPLGLLLESPEPLDWQRIEMELSHHAAHQSIEEFNSSVKIVDLKSSPSDQWIEMIILKEANLSGWKIQTKENEQLDYIDFYIFETEQTLPEGSILRIHHTLPPASEIQDEFLHRFADTPSPHTSQSGTQIRLLNQQGQIVHQKTVFQEGWNRINTLVIKNQDESKAFIFLINGDQTIIPFPQVRGIYQLNWRFKRELGTDVPRLKQNGMLTDEETTLEFSLI